MKRTFLTAICLAAAVAALGFTGTNAEAASPFSVRIGGHGVQLRFGYGARGHRHHDHHGHFNRYGGGYPRSYYGGYQRSYYPSYDCPTRGYSRRQLGPRHGYYDRFGYR